MTDGGVAYAAGWQERAITNSDSVRRSRARTLRTAQLLIDDAYQLLYVNGESFTINQLVAHAGIALQTFYRHFPGKDELLLATYEHTVETGIADIAALAGRAPAGVKRLQVILESTIMAAAVQPRTRIIASEHMRIAHSHPAVVAKVAQSYRTLVKEAIEAGNRKGSLHSSDPERDARFVSDAVTITVHNLALGVTTEPVAQVSEHTCSILLSALGGRAPRRRRRG